MAWILVVEDDPAVANMLRRMLVREGYGVVCAGSSFEAENLLDTRPFQLVLLDLRLGNEKSFHLAKELSSRGDLGVVFVSGSDDVTDKVVALELGAEDYIVKPFDDKELMARIRSVFRRMNHRLPAGESRVVERYTFDGLVLDARTQQLFDRSGRDVPLSRFEFRLLKLFVSRGYEPVTREQISLQINRRPHVPTDRTIDVIVAKLRKRLGAHVIETVRGEGYRMGVAVETDGKSEEGKRQKGQDVAAIYDAMGPGTVSERVPWKTI